MSGEADLNVVQRRICYSIRDPTQCRQSFRAVNIYIYLHDSPRVRRTRIATTQHKHQLQMDAGSPFFSSKCFMVPMTPDDEECPKRCIILPSRTGIKVGLIDSKESCDMIVFAGEPHDWHPEGTDGCDPSDLVLR